MRLPLRSLCLLLVLTLSAASAQAKAPLKATVVLDRTDAMYAVGDEVQFTITLPDTDDARAAKLVYQIDNDGGAIAAKQGELAWAKEPQVFRATLDQPGFLRCRVGVMDKGRFDLWGVAAAAISPEKIEPSMPAPDDFDAFWAAEKAKLAKIPLEPKLTPAASPKAEIECFDVQIQCVDNVPVSGFLGRPKGAAPKSLPAILWTHGAGVGPAQIDNAIKGASLGMLSLDINAHGLPNDKPKEYYINLSTGELKNYWHWGRDDREKCYFRGMFLRVCRALDFLAAQPEWDGKVLAIIGHSQGGGQALAGGALDGRVTFIGFGIPALCDHTGMLAKRPRGWPGLVRLANGKPDPKSLEASRYFDGVNFAARFKGEGITAVGFLDSCCAPTTCYAAYNQLSGKKQILNNPKGTHSVSPQVADAFNAALLAHAKQRTGK